MYQNNEIHEGNLKPRNSFYLFDCCIICIQGGMDGNGRYYGGGYDGGECAGIGGGSGLVGGGRRVPSKGETKATPPLPPSLSPHQIGGEMYRNLVAHQYDQYMARLAAGLPPSPTHRPLPPPTHSPIPPSAHSPIPLPRFSPQQQQAAALLAAAAAASSNNITINGGNCDSVGPPLRSLQLPQSSPSGSSSRTLPTPSPPSSMTGANTNNSCVNSANAVDYNSGNSDTDERARHRRKQDQPRRQTVIYAPGLSPTSNVPSDDSGGGYCSSPPPPSSSSQQHSLPSPLSHDMPISQAMSHALAHPFLAAHLNAHPPPSTPPANHSSPRNSPLSSRSAHGNSDASHQQLILDNKISHCNKDLSNNIQQMHSSHNSPHMPSSHSPLIHSSHNSPHMPISHSPLMHSPIMPSSHSPHLNNSHNSPRMHPSTAQNAHNNSLMANTMDTSRNNSPHVMPPRSSPQISNLNHQHQSSYDNPSHLFNNHNLSHHGLLSDVTDSGLFLSRSSTTSSPPPRPTSESSRHSDQSLGSDPSRNSDLARMELSHSIHSPLPPSSPVTMTRSSYNGPLPQATATAREVPENVGSGPTLDCDIPEDEVDGIESVTPTFPPPEVDVSNYNNNRHDYGNSAASFYSLGEHHHHLIHQHEKYENNNGGNRPSDSTSFGPTSTKTPAQKKSLSPLKTINLAALDTSDPREEEISDIALAVRSTQKSPINTPTKAGKEILCNKSSYGFPSGESANCGHFSVEGNQANMLNVSTESSKSNASPSKKIDVDNGNQNADVSTSTKQAAVQSIPALYRTSSEQIDYNSSSALTSPAKERLSARDELQKTPGRENNIAKDVSSDLKKSNDIGNCANGITDSNLSDTLMDNLKKDILPAPQNTKSKTNSNVDSDFTPIVNGNQSVVICPTKKNRKRKHEFEALSPLDLSELCGDGENKRRTRQRRAVSYVEDGTDPVLEMNDFTALSPPGFSPTKKRGRKSKEAKMNELSNCNDTSLLDALSPSSTTTTDSQSLRDTLSPDRDAAAGLLSPMVSPGVGRPRSTRGRGRGRGKNAASAIAIFNNNNALSDSMAALSDNGSTTVTSKNQVDGTNIISRIPGEEDVYDFPTAETDANCRGRRGRRGRKRGAGRRGAARGAAALASSTQHNDDSIDKLPNDLTLRGIEKNIEAFPKDTSDSASFLTAATTPDQIKSSKQGETELNEENKTEKPRSSFPFLTVKDPSVLLEKYDSKDDDGSNDELLPHSFRAMADLSQCLVNSHYDSKDGDSSGDGFSPSSKVKKSPDDNNLDMSLIHQQMLSSATEDKDDDAPSIAYIPRMGRNREQPRMSGSMHESSEKSAIEQVLMTLNENIASLDANNANNTNESLDNPAPNMIATAAATSASNSHLGSALPHCNPTASIHGSFGPVVTENLANMSLIGNNILASNAMNIVSVSSHNPITTSVAINSLMQTFSTSQNDISAASLLHSNNNSVVNSIPRMSTEIGRNSVSILPTTLQPSCSMASISNNPIAITSEVSVSIIPLPGETNKVSEADESTISTPVTITKRNSPGGRGRGKKRAATVASRGRPKFGQDVQADPLGDLNNEESDLSVAASKTSVSDIDPNGKSLCGIKNMSDQSMDNIAACQSGGEHSVYVMSIAEAVMSGSGRATSRRSGGRSGLSADNLNLTSSGDHQESSNSSSTLASTIDTVVDGPSATSVGSGNIIRGRRTTRRSSQRNVEPEVVVQVEVHPEPQTSSHIPQPDLCSPEKVDDTNLSSFSSNNSYANSVKPRDRTPPTNQDDMDDIIAAPERETNLRSLRSLPDSRSCLRTGQSPSESHTISLSKSLRSFRSNSHSHVNNSHASTSVNKTHNDSKTTNKDSDAVNQVKLDEAFGTENVVPPLCSASGQSNSSISVVAGSSAVPAETEINAALAVATTVDSTPGSASNDTDSETIENIAQFLRNTGGSSSPAVTESGSLDGSVPNDSLVAANLSAAVVPGRSKLPEAVKALNSGKSVAPAVASSSTSYRDSRPRRAARPPQSEEQVNEVLMLLNMDDEESEDEDYVPKESNLGSDENGSDADEDSADTSNDSDDDSDDSAVSDNNDTGDLDFAVESFSANDVSSVQKTSGSRSRKKVPTRKRNRTKDRNSKAKSSSQARNNRGKIPVEEPELKRRKGNDGRRLPPCDDSLVSPYIQLDPELCEEYVNNEPYSDINERPTNVHKASTVHFFVEGETKQRYTKVGFNSTLHNNYDAFSKDLTWFCALCKQFSHRFRLGDLFGPIFIDGITLVKKLYPSVIEGLIPGGISGGDATDAAGCGITTVSGRSKNKSRVTPRHEASAVATDHSSKKVGYFFLYIQYMYLLFNLFHIKLYLFECDFV